jgi:D-alanyl-D-alanine carboxypeptidase/D-alanyl-D-alanine-endopeptidase (penicillin-binding protein 4)
MSRLGRLTTFGLRWVLVSLCITTLAFGATGKSSKTARRASSKSSSTVRSSSRSNSESSSRSTAKPVAVALASFADRAEAIVDDYKSLQVGICVMRPDTGEVLYAHNADELLIPASNRKLFVTALALHHLGPDYRFSTPLYLSRRPDGPGPFSGNLIVRGKGDPTFLNPRFGSTPYTTFRDWTEALARLGVRSIQGNLIMDSSGFAAADHVADGWVKNFETAEYAPRASGICMQGNIIDLYIRPGAVGEPTVVTCMPANSTVQVDNQTETGPRRTRDSLVLERGDGGMDHLVLRGRLASTAGQQGMRIPLEQPDRVAGDVLRSHLQKAGIPLRGDVLARNGDVAISPAGWFQVAEHLSPPLRDIIAVTNKKSDNHCGEQLFQAVTFAKTGSASYAKAKRFEESFLAQVGILPSEANFEDGCGLSRLDLVSASAVTKLLQFMARHPYADVYRYSLSVAGQDGTLRGRLGGAATGRIFAKTGSVAVACTLSGYAETKAGVMVAFSILCNNQSGRLTSAHLLQDRLCQLIVNTDLPASAAPAVQP